MWYARSNGSRDSELRRTFGNRARAPLELGATIVPRMDAQMLDHTQRERISRLLIVENDKSQLRTLTDLMGEEGFEVIACETAAEALEHVNDANFSVTIVDLHLPDLGGTELLEKIRRLSGKVQVIIHTGYGSYDSAKAALNLGAFAYVEKLGDPTQLIRHVHRAFRTGMNRYAAELEVAVAERTGELTKSNANLRQHITDRRRAEERLAESEERFRRAIMDAPVPIMIHAEDGKVVQINRAWVELSGYSADQIPTIGDWTEKAYGQRKEGFRAVISKLYELDCRVDEGDFPLTTQGGQARHWDFSSAPLGRLPDGRRAVISTALDVTERKEAEAALHASNERYQDLYDNAPDMFCSVDAATGRVVQCNLTLAAMLGFSREELLGRHISELCHPNCEPDSKKVFEAFVHQGEARDVELQLLRSDGSKLDVSLSVSAVRDEQGSIIIDL